MNSTVNTLIEKMMPAFCESVKQTFETMVFMNIKCGVAGPRLPNQPRGWISGTIGLSGDGVCGSVSLVLVRSMAEKCFRSMMMMGDSDPVKENEVMDAIGEIANMTAGGSKAILQEQGIKFVIGLPTVVVGEDHYISSPADAATSIVAVDSDKGGFFIQVSVS